MERYRTGMLARSIAGRDAGRTYVIIDSDDAYVYLADGESRTLHNPKKKKKKHIQPICTEFDISGMDDAALRWLLKKWCRIE